MTKEEALEWFKDRKKMYCLDDKCQQAEDMAIKALEQGHCKDCKYFEYDSMVKVDGVPLIVAHEICLKWGDGCKTSEDGYCFLFEPKMQAESEEI